MIIGIGTDLIDIRRIQKILCLFPERFKQRIFTSHEQNRAHQSHFPAASFAKRFAAKEACLKALSIGRAFGIGWKDIEIRNTSTGQPEIHVSDALQAYIERKFGPHTFNFFVSLTDTKHMAQAFVIIEME